jgi:hypothetical protein
MSGGLPQGVYSVLMRVYEEDKVMALGRVNYTCKCADCWAALIDAHELTHEAMILRFYFGSGDAASPEKNEKDVDRYDA